MIRIVSALALAAALAGSAAAAPPSGGADDAVDKLMKGEDQQQGPHEPEPWLLPYSHDQTQSIDKGLGRPDAFSNTHDELHKTIEDFRKQPDMTPDKMRAGFSNLVQGVRGFLDGGLRYANLKDSQATEDEKKAQLAAIAQDMEKAKAQLKEVKIDGHGAFGHMLMDQQQPTELMDLEHKIDPNWHKKEQNSGPPDPGVLAAAGNQELQDGNPSAALQDFNNALSLDPGNADALTGRGAANMDLKNFKDAAQDARDALQVSPDNPAAKAILALAHDGVADGVNINKASPFSDQASSDGAGGAARGAPGLGQSSLRYLPPANGSGLQSSAYTREALRSLAVGDMEAASKQAAKAIALDPKNADAYGLRAFAQARAGHYDEALKDSMAALALDPANTMAHNARAKALNKMGLYSEALAAADDALRANPRNAYAYYMKAMALNGLGQRSAMLSALGQAAALDPRFQDAYDLAKSAPAEKDMGFLFPEDQLAAARAALNNAQAAGPKRYFWGLTMPMIVGAALVLLGLLHYASSWAMPRLRDGYAAAVRTGPSLGKSEADVGLPTPPPLPTGRHAPAGTVLRGQYRRLGQIGSSVHGAVYEGVDQALERRVAIRKLRADMRAADRERLMAPARAAAGLAHVGIAPVYAVFEEGESLYLVSEFAPGRSLRDSMASRGPLSWEEALPLFRQAAAALDYAHGKDVVHGAVKSSNLMLSPEGRVKLIDFGLSRGPADKADDLGAFAACLREAIAGLSPARLDAVDAALARARPSLVSAAQVVDVVETGLASAL
jgi:tetratricopeptide (TPR) repeat protein/tRNA A-37 threonylcarbamoyl transferase component Bud32